MMKRVKVLGGYTKGSKNKDVSSFMPVFVRPHHEPERRRQRIPVSEIILAPVLFAVVSYITTKALEKLFEEKETS
jgi:hypothetical protein